MNRLEYFRLFYNIPLADFELFEASLSKRSYAKGDCITVPGEIQRELLLVEEGVQMSYFDADDKQHVIAFTYPPNLCAVPESFMFQQPSPYFLTCLTKSEFRSVSFERLQSLFDESRHIERLFRRMTEAVLAGFISRHRELLTLSIEERFTTFCQRSPHLLKLVPHKYIASYLGINATNFSKLFNSVRL